MIFNGLARIGWSTRVWLADIGHAARLFVRLLSFARMKPTPRIVVGDEANTATAAKVGTKSDMSRISTSMPCNSVPLSRLTITECDVY